MLMVICLLMLVVRVLIFGVVEVMGNLEGDGVYWEGLIGNGWY